MSSLLPNCRTRRVRTRRVRTRRGRMWRAGTWRYKILPDTSRVRTAFAVYPGTCRSRLRSGSNRAVFACLVVLLVCPVVLPVFFHFSGLEPGLHRSRSGLLGKPIRPDRDARSASWAFPGGRNGGKEAGHRRRRQVDSQASRQTGRQASSQASKQAGGQVARQGLTSSGTRGCRRP